MLMPTVKGVARLLNMLESWVYERTRREEIPGFKVGKYGRFDGEEVQAWFEQFRKGPKFRGDEARRGLVDELSKEPIPETCACQRQHAMYHFAMSPQTGDPSD
jgi:excisionase family DNA binding protein